MLKISRKIFVSVVIASSILSACGGYSSITPEILIEPGIEEIFAFMPNNWGIIELEGSAYSYLLYLNLAQYRSDKGIAPVTGEDQWENKNELVTAFGKDLQSLNVKGPGNITPATSQFYAKWGWDVADIDQYASLPAFELTMYFGNFSRPLIGERLESNGKFLELKDEFSIFELEEGIVVAWSPRVMLFGTEEI